MRILSAIISSIWNTVTFMDKEQRALVAHVLTVSQAHPKSFNYDNQHGTWQSKGLKITFWERHGIVELSNVKYETGWRARAILVKHFAMLHICLHHEHIGKALSEIDKSENEPRKNANTYDNQQAVGDIEPQPSSSIITNLKREFARRGVVKKIAPEPIDLAKYVGKNCYVEMSNGDKGNCHVNYLQTEDAVLLLDSQLLFNRYGKHVYGYDLHVTLIRELEGSFRDCIKADDVITPVDNFESLHLSGWTTDIDLTHWIGKTVDVKLRDGTPINNVLVSAKQNGLVCRVNLGCMPYTKNGNYWHYQLNDRDIVAIRIAK